MDLVSLATREYDLERTEVGPYLLAAANDVFQSLRIEGDPCSRCSLKSSSISPGVSSRSTP